MALPKRKTSKARKGNRHSHTHVIGTTVGICPQCRAPKAAHRACPSCGYYRGRQTAPAEPASGGTA